MGGSRSIDMTGQRFGMLVALEKVGVDRHGNARWRFRCDCGGESITTRACVRTETTSCGCRARALSAERGRKSPPSSTTHGLYRHPLYNTWAQMRARCENPNAASYRNYGGRGITVDPRWNTFPQFLADMGERPADPPDWPGQRAYWSLDRFPDPDGPYSPENCRWATPEEQNARRRPWRKRSRRTA